MDEFKERAKGAAERAKGKIKEQAGDALDDERMEAEGRREQIRGEDRGDMARSTGRLKGSLEETKGSLKSGVGDVTDDESLEAEGELERAKGRARRKLNE
jgi:uncharacterized protein YjbJ (UPF0337 family)